MNSFLINVASAVTAAAIIGWMGLDKSPRRIEIVQAGRVGWFWKLSAFAGKFFFYYGLLVFLANLAVGGIENNNTLVGLSFTTFGFIFWVVGRIVIYFQRD